MLELLERLFDTRDFPARWICGQWSPLLGWTHIVADVAVWAAYMAIPVALAIVVQRRRDTPFPRIFWLFCAFIFACGTGHLVDAVLFWHPVYRVSVLVRVVTAVVSWATVIALVPALPRVLALPARVDLARQVDLERLRREEAVRLADQCAAELRRAQDEVQRVERAAVGRELRILEVKAEVNELLARLGEQARYAHDGTTLLLHHRRHETA